MHPAVIGRGDRDKAGRSPAAGQAPAPADQQPPALPAYRLGLPAYRNMIDDRLIVCHRCRMPCPLIVYLDQNKWIELLRGAQEPSTANVLAMLRSGVADGSLVVPLSAAHYLETWHRTDWHSRHELAQLMRNVSNFATLAPFQHLQCIETEALLLDHFRSPRCECKAPQTSDHLLGRGVNHAFHSATGRMRLVDRVASDSVEEGSHIPPPADLLRKTEAARARPDDAYEWWSLAGTPDGLAYPDFEVRAEHRLGLKRVRRETALAERFAADSKLRHRLDDYLITEELNEALDHLNNFAFWHNADTGKLKDTWRTTGPDFGRFLLNLMPTRVCVFHMRRAKHRNPQWPWQQHDRTDIAALASAVPYTDIVVTERQWAHVFRSAGLDKRFSTRVLNRLTDLVPLIV